MQQDGPRLKKLKEIYKKAIQEILKTEDDIHTMLASSMTKDSFYSNASAHFKQEDISAVFVQLKQRFTEIFKEKIKRADLDILLNCLDKDIKERRMGYQDIACPAYIREIFDSHVVDKKEQFIKSLEEEGANIANSISAKENEISDLKGQIRKVEEENALYEQIYNRILEEMEQVCEH
ncbi:hypothetical protein ENBRE01_1664 [Enteropsectra breve]|nr:hypothetical protein ENBRE01_1664 [Enteropsectra breve]